MRTNVTIYWARVLRIERRPQDVTVLAIFPVGDRKGRGTGDIVQVGCSMDPESISIRMRDSPPTLTAVVPALVSQFLPCSLGGSSRGTPALQVTSTASKTATLRLPVITSDILLGNDTGKHRLPYLWDFRWILPTQA